MTRWSLKQPWLRFGLSLVVAAVFLDAGIMKLRDPMGFAEQIAGFRLLPPALVPGVAMALPWLETLGGFLLVAMPRGRAGPFTLLILSCIFAVALGQALWRGLEPSCGCFGPVTDASRAALWLALGRDLLLVAATAWLYGKRGIANSGGRQSPGESFFGEA